MGAGIGKMFGVDKLFGGLLDSIGLGALKPLVSVAFDFATGNLPGILQDLTSLMSSFGNNSFNNVASKPPMPDAFNAENEQDEYGSNATDRNQNAFTNCACRENDNELSSNRLGELFKLLGELFKAKEPGDMMAKLSQLFKLLSENAENRQTVDNARTNVQFFSGGVTISA